MNGWWWKIARYARPEAASLAKIGLLMLVGVGLSLLTPWPLKLIVDNVLSDKPLPESLSWIRALPGAESPNLLLGWLAGATVGLFLLTKSVSVWQRYVETGAGSRMVYAIAADLFSHLQHRPLLLHYQGKSGDLIKRVTSDTACVRELILRAFVPGARSAVTLGGMFVIMWHMSHGLAIFALGLSIPLLIIVRLLAEPLANRRFHEHELQGQMYSLAEQTLSAMPLIQSCGREQHHNDHFRSLAHRTIGANLRFEWTGHQFKVGTAAVTTIATACVMVYGGLAVQNGTLSTGGLLVLMAYFAALYSPLETLAYLTEGFASAKAGARRVLEILEEEIRPLADSPDACPLSFDKASRGAAIRFADVAYGYAPDRPVLDGVSFDVDAGEIVAIVGETGAGKSTLMSLLLRFFDPWRGSIYIGDADIQKITLASLRDHIAFMPQKPFLLPLTIAENIAYGRPSATHQEIEDAAAAAKAAEFIRDLPRGYDTNVGERGTTLSAGQKQRLSLARALLKNAPILILDEPTSALDPATEASIVDDVLTLFDGRTTFIITHRFSTIERATSAVVVEGGSVIEFGSPRELLAARGRFYQLHQLQFGQQSHDSPVNACVSR